MNELTPTYFLNALYALLTAPGAFVQDVLVLKGLRSNITAEYTLQIYPTNLREETRAQNVLTCTDTWIIGGVVKTSEENLVDKTWWTKPFLLSRTPKRPWINLRKTAGILHTPCCRTCKSHTTVSRMWRSV